MQLGKHVIPYEGHIQDVGGTRINLHGTSWHSTPQHRNCRQVCLAYVQHVVTFKGHISACWGHSAIIAHSTQKKTEEHSATCKAVWMPCQTLDKHSVCKCKLKLTPLPTITFVSNPASTARSLLVCLQAHIPFPLTMATAVFLSRLPHMPLGFGPYVEVQQEPHVTSSSAFRV